MKPGDLIRISHDWRGHSLTLWKEQFSLSHNVGEVGQIERGDVAVVIAVREGANKALVELFLLTNGRLGWMDEEFFEKIP